MADALTDTLQKGFVGAGAAETALTSDNVLPSSLRALDQIGRGYSDQA